MKPPSSLSSTTVSMETNITIRGQTKADPVEEPAKIIRQPETRPISQEQLEAEVKGIYAALVMVEAKCIEVDNEQAVLAQSDPASLLEPNPGQWQALIALHRTLLHEHHDFFLASQHPSASPAMLRVASKYAMPARMWRHGIHSFLEVLRHRLPASLDHKLAFIYLAYSMMALLYETVPAFDDTWIECLGDLARYRMAIEDDDVRDRDVWTGAARNWYSKASDKTPSTGRLYHHLAILARPNALLQLFYYSKSLCVAVPFPLTRDSILILFDPVLNGTGQYRLPPFDIAFVKSHGLLFTDKNMDKFRPAAGQNNPLIKAIYGTSRDASEAPETIDEKAVFEDAEYLANEVLKIVLKRAGDPNVLSFIHVTLVFMYFMSRCPRAMRYVEARFPWQLLVEMLNPLLTSYPTPDRIESTAFPVPVKDHIRPFTEDFAMRGLTWSVGYYPEPWFPEDKLDDEESYLEVASIVEGRKERILWLASHIAKAGPWISYDRERRRFSTLIDADPVANGSDGPGVTHSYDGTRGLWAIFECFGSGPKNCFKDAVATISKRTRRPRTKN